MMSTLALANTDQKLKSAISRAQGVLDRMERYEKELAKHFERIEQAGMAEPVVIAAYERKIGEWQSASDKVAAQLAALPDGTAEVAAIKKRHAEAIVRVDSVKARMAREQGKNDDATKLASSDDAAKDAAALAALSAVFLEIRMAATGDKGSEVLAQYAPGRADIARLGQIYEPALKRGNHVSVKGTMRQLVESYGRAKEAAEQVESLKAQLAGSLPTEIDKLLADVKKLSLELTGGGFAITAAQAQSRLARARHKAVVYDTLCAEQAGYQPGRLATIASAEADFAKQVVAKRAAIIAANQPVADTYAGADKATLVGYYKKFWKDTFPTDKLLAVRMPEGWNRFGGVKWSDANKAWEKYDYSTIFAEILVESPDRKQIFKYGAQIKKHHLSGDRTTIEAGEHWVPPISPVHIMLRSALK